NDCDGSVDRDATDAVRYFEDADRDGYGTGSGGLYCDVPDGFVSVPGDCDDIDAAVHPDATEVCDGVDNDCNDDVDDDAADALSWYPDEDADGFGAGAALLACEAPSGHVDDDNDCDDAAVTVFPGAIETWYDGIDGDCAGDDDYDADADGYRSDEHGGSDCLDTDAEVVPDGAGLCSLGHSCLDIVYSGRADEDGLYTIDPDGTDTGEEPFEVMCDLTTDGGGWTQLTGELLSDQDWVRFTHEGGAGTGSMGWIGAGTFVIEPVGSGCNTAAARATATLPFGFTEWKGSWTGRGQSSESNQDDNRADLGWGEVTSNCTGHTQFGTETVIEKDGGDWGGDWNYMGSTRTWDWEAEVIPEATEVRWEVVDQGSNEDVVVYDIDIWVR
ncbi:MAG: MopE-related protein, partial [Myxococcota bacterium]